MNKPSHTWILSLLSLAACACTHDEQAAPLAGDAKPTHPIEILATAAQRAGVRSAPVKLEHLARLIHAPAEIVLDPDRTAHLSPLVEAKIEKVVVKLGDNVRVGDVLAVLRSIAVGESRASLTETEADLELARANMNRQEALRRSKIGAARSYEEAVAGMRRAEAGARAARERSRVVGSYELRAPIAGTVIARHATIGETVGPSTVLFTVAELGEVWVVGQVYERDVGAVAVQAPSKLTLAAYPERTWTGAISYVAEAVEHETRTLPVRMVLPNPDGSLRPGLFGSLRIEANDAIEALAVPAEAVQRMVDRSIVFVGEPSADSTRVRFSARAVTLGRDSGALVEVKSGLTAGESVAVSGTFTLRGELLRDTLAEED
jgi:cobalt-zinc-cadmium efflux system membrane fusion protein